MNNYHYIITGLPVLTTDFENQTFSYEDLSASIKEQLSEKDRKIVDWLEFGFDSDHLSHHFYRGLKAIRHPFIVEYFRFDTNLRNIMVRAVAAREHLDEKKYMVGEIDSKFEEYPKLQQILENPNIIERELQIDRLKWDKISDMTNFHYFDLDVILGFLAKGKIVQRWIDMDKETGARLFEQYVQEVRGTFKGIDFKTKNKN